MRGKKFNSLADACAHAGCDLSEVTSDKDGWFDMEGDGKTLEFMVDEDTAIVMHKNLPAEDSSCASH
jgi:frataxin-like iron-binding protein CyaY